MLLIIIFLTTFISVQASWTWISGSNLINQPGNYGGFGSPLNIPGARYSSAFWKDSSNNLWLFGGIGYASTGAVGWLNDLWKFDGMNWIWISGSNLRNQPGNYGTKGIASSSNIPSAREGATYGIDSNNNLWLFGGAASNTARLSDLWKFDGTNWTWISGSNLINQPGTYGTKGIASSSNIPGASNAAISWIDSNNNFWLFGGYGYASTGIGYLNDLWKFDGTNWTWISGSNLVNQNGNYGTKGVASSSNIPGARYDSVSWIDSNNNFWLFGGIGYAATGSFGWLNDMWKFDGMNWTWISGSNLINQPGTYGTKGIASSSNIPGARSNAVSWINSNNNLWLFGGRVSNSGYLNDFWRFDGINWTWISGSNLINQNGNYDGILSASNIPGARESAVSWKDSSDNNFWLFGGYGYAIDGSAGEYLNDLWKVTFSTINASSVVVPRRVPITTQGMISNQLTTSLSTGEIISAQLNSGSITTQSEQFTSGRVNENSGTGTIVIQSSSTTASNTDQNVSKASVIQGIYSELSSTIIGLIVALAIVMFVSF